MNQYKYKYFFLPKKFKAIADIHIALTEFKTSGKMVVREKIDLVRGISVESVEECNSDD